jgi:hypothetical protein
MRDDLFFQYVRIPRSRYFNVPDWLLWEHYVEFNKDEDDKIIRFILDKHPEAWDKYWKHHVFSPVSLNEIEEE